MSQGNGGAAAAETAVTAVITAVSFRICYRYRIMAATMGLGCFLMNIAGLITMLIFGSSLGNHNPYLGFHGDMDAASRACYKTAVVFGGLAAASLLYFIVAAVREKRGYGGTRGSYSAVWSE